MQPEGPTYCRCSLPHTNAEVERERLVLSRLREEWEYILRNPVYVIAPDGTKRVLPAPALGPSYGSLAT